MVSQEDKTIQDAMKEIFEEEIGLDQQMKDALDVFGYIDLRRFARDHGVGIAEVSQIMDRLMEHDNRLFRIYTLGNQKIIKR